MQASLNHMLLVFYAVVDTRFQEGVPYARLFKATPPPPQNPPLHILVRVEAPTTKFAESVNLTFAHDV